jgi:hypothetical protein
MNSLTADQVGTYGEDKKKTKKAVLSICDLAAKSGDLEKLKWAIKELKVPVDENMSLAASAGGSLEVLQWLRSQNPPCPWNAGVCSGAAENGQMHVLRWLRAQDPPCPWDERVCANASLHCVAIWIC